jgi:hypothetical protein
MTRRRKLSLSPEQERRREAPTDFGPAGQQARRAPPDKAKTEGPGETRPALEARLSTEQTATAEATPAPRGPRPPSSPTATRDQATWPSVATLAKAALVLGAAALSIFLLVRRGF